MNKGKIFDIIKKQNLSAEDKNELKRIIIEHCINAIDKEDKHIFYLIMYLHFEDNKYENEIVNSFSTLKNKYNLDAIDNELYLYTLFELKESSLEKLSK